MYGPLSTGVAILPIQIHLHRHKIAQQLRIVPKHRQDRSLLLRIRVIHELGFRYPQVVELAVERVRGHGLFATFRQRDGLQECNLGVRFASGCGGLFFGRSDRRFL
jgi:hypothetical protein